jgi:hypothetical protein
MDPMVFYRRISNALQRRWRGCVFKAALKVLGKMVNVLRVTVFGF